MIEIIESKDYLEETFSTIIENINEESSDYFEELLEHLQGMGEVIGVLASDENACFEEDSLEFILKLFVTCLCIEAVFQHYSEKINESREHIRLTAATICKAVDTIAGFEEGLSPSFISEYNWWTNNFL